MQNAVNETVTYAWVSRYELLPPWC